MRVTLDLYRADDGRLEGVVHTPGDTGATFAGLLDLLRVLEGLDLSGPSRHEHDAAAGDGPAGEGAHSGGPHDGPHGGGR